MKGAPPPSGDDPDAGAGRSLVAVLARGNADTPAHRRFRRLIDKIERVREELKKWEDFAHRYAQRLRAEVEPLQAQLLARQREMALLIGELLSGRDRDPRTRLRTQDRSTLGELLKELLASLRELGPDEELAALRAKHIRPDKREQQEMDLAEQMLKEVYGVELDEDHDAASVEEMFEEARRKLDERQEEEEARRESARQGSGRQGGNRKAGPAHTSRDGVLKQISQSVRELYRKLVSVLHPDREPDPEERERKTRLMQRVNQAYEAHDLLTLLSLQLELAPADARQLPPRERLDQYSDALRQQLTGLETRLKGIREAYFPLMGREVRTLSVSSVDRQLTIEIRKAQEAVQQLQDDIVRFRDPDQRRARLDQVAQEQQERRHMEELSMAVDAALERDLAEVFGEHTPRRRRRKSRRRR